MKKIEITLNDETLKAIALLKCPATGKPLTPENVFQVLAEDLGMTITRPGSWEAANMQEVVISHGWEQS